MYPETIHVSTGRTNAIFGDGKEVVAMIEEFEVGFRAEMVRRYNALPSLLAAIEKYLEVFDNPHQDNIITKHGAAVKAMRNAIRSLEGETPDATR